ncbi:MAG TPA: polymorphic toxin-type HINT domain-containing protein [Pirellulaceae bacterium]|nr:polymorphic toxin-type HINT domain-containing protein [Pirellulaceae bacterium]
MFFSTRTLLRSSLVLASGAGLLVTSCWSARAAGPTQKLRTAQGLVREALAQESLGLPAQRDALLAEAERTSPHAASIQWARGVVRFDDRWVASEDVPSLARVNPTLTRYQKLRSEAVASAPAQASLATWCQKHDLPEQARAHWEHVIELQPDHAVAREQLGYIRNNSRWLHQPELIAAQRAAAVSAAQFKRWEARIRDLHHDLQARSSQQRQAAAQRLQAIDDPAAIPAIEAILCYELPDIAAPAVATLGAMTAPEASLAIARVSVNSPWRMIRDSAARQLPGRPYEQFVPQLLAGLYTATAAQAIVTQGPDGRLIHQQVFVREGQDQKEVLLRGTEYNRQAVAGGSAGFALQQVARDLSVQNMSAERRLTLQNRGTAEQNERITGALSIAIDQPLGADPKNWWAWWNEHNDVKTQGEKAVAYAVALRSIDVLDGVPTTGGGGGGSGGGGSNPECLIAGTVVRTQLGDMPIEQIRRGDLVLSQDVESGELAFKPVIKTTITPSGPIYRVDAGFDERFECTGGHLFWVVGDGWKQARELRSGMQLHGPRGSLTVSDVTPVGNEQTYNLIVADFHSYFAGRSAALCHDNTLRRPTQAIVPGVVVK